LHALVGADGFVDSLVHVVDTRQSPASYNRVETIEAFAKRLMGASGLSTNIELVSYHTKLGGNGPIMAEALLCQGADVSYFGAIAQPGLLVPDMGQAGMLNSGLPRNKTVHSQFRSLASRCTAVYPIAPPGLTDALEFLDGKLMFGKHASMLNISWDSVVASFGGLEDFAQAVASADLLCLVNWTMLPNMSGVWRGMVDKVFPLVPERPTPPCCFFDLCDPQKRTHADIQEALELITKFSARFRVVLGLNLKELYEVAAALELTAQQDKAMNSDPSAEKELSRRVYQALGVHTLVVHPVREAFAWSLGEYAHAPDHWRRRQLQRRV
jgi:hypothetical protein